MLRRFVIRAWIDYECSTSIAKFTPVTTIIFLLNKICDGGSSKEPFLKAATLSILIWAYPRETKTNNGNYTNAAILPSEVAYRRRACALILPLCRFHGKDEKHAKCLREWLFCSERKEKEFRNEKLSYLRTKLNFSCEIEGSLYRPSYLRTTTLARA